MGQTQDDLGAPLRVGRITIHPNRYEVYVDRQRVDLTLTQFRLLKTLARRPGWVVKPEQFQGRWGRASGAAEAASTRGGVKHHVSALRRKLGVAAVQLQTVRGEGYRLVEASPLAHEDSAEN